MQSRQYRSSESITAQQQRPRCWPSTYVDPPPLIITDNGVRRATTPVPSVAVATVADAKIPSGDSEGELVRVVVDPPSSAAADDDVIDSECRGRDVIVTVTTKTVVTKLDDDDDDSQRLLTSSTVELNAAASTTGGVNVGTPMTGGGVDGPLAADDA